MKSSIIYLVFFDIMFTNSLVCLPVLFLMLLGAVTDLSTATALFQRARGVTTHGAAVARRSTRLRQLSQLSADNFRLIELRQGLRSYPKK
jgi:hypothetical protein